MLIPNAHYSRSCQESWSALDGKVWWCVYDLNKHTFSTLICFGKYKTKKDCLFAINKKGGYL